MGIFFIVGSIQAGIFFCLLTSKKSKVLSDKILAVWFLIMGLHLLFQYFDSINIYYDYPHLLAIDSGFPVLYGPLLYFYFDSLTNNRRKIPKIYLLHFIPFLLITLGLIPFYINTAEFKIQIYNNT